ncbi:RDD family protein, partial [Planctomycetota bacterium]|nr:RDD family protein [Planctomycetota bacterium]
TYAVTGKDSDPFVVGLRKIGDDSRKWVLSVFDGTEWHQAAPPPRESPPSSLDVSISMDMVWHKDELWAVYSDAQKIKLAKGTIGNEHIITWAQGKALELDESRGNTEIMTMLAVLVTLAMLTFLQAVWLMLNRSRGLERVIEDVIDKSDADMKDALGAKTKEKRPLFASPLARASALLIDLAMTAPFVMMLRGVYHYELTNAYSFLNFGSALLADESLMVVLRATLVTMLILAVYSSTCEFFWGKTFGKALLRLRVESLDGEPLAAWQVMIRNIFKIVELGHYILILIPMSFMLMSTKQQRLGDFLGRTIVILDIVPEEQADDLDV